MANKPEAVATIDKQAPTQTDIQKIADENRIAVKSLEFTRRVEDQFAAELGQSIAWTDYQKTLAQHLFIKVDQTLRAAELKRNSGPAFQWGNVNMPKLAIDAVHRVTAELDALLRNHIHPIPYLNTRSGKYDIDLRIGFEGKIHMRLRFAIDPLKDLRFYKVYQNDTLQVFYKSADTPVESFRLLPGGSNPFADRGELVGVVGYAEYADPTKNRLWLIGDRDFSRAKKAAKGNNFWTDNDEEMKLKTAIHRVCDQIPLDPLKINASTLMAIESSMDDALEAEVELDSETYGNGEVLSIESKLEPVPEVAASEPVAVAAGQGSLVSDDEQGPGY